MTQWERAVDAAAQQLATEIPDKWKRMSQISKDYWRASAAAALRAALPVLFEVPYLIGVPHSVATSILQQSREALEAEASQ